MKKRIITIGTILFMCVALISVGFAAWVITGNTSKDITGNVQTDTVTEENYTLEDIKTEGVEDIIFGAPVDATTGWLTNADGPKENLNVVKKYTVKKGNSPVADLNTGNLAGNDSKAVTLTKDKTKIEVKLEVVDTAKDYANAVAAGLITDPAINLVGGADGSLTITVGAKWGTHFENSNPYTFYNKHTQEDKKADALTQLALLEKVKSARFKVTITVSTNNAI